MIIYLDIDGTIADAKKRFKKAGAEPKGRGKRWDLWLRKVQNKKLLASDEPVAAMVEFANAICADTIYLTGRSEVYREVTEMWLEENGFPICALLMRPRGNRQKNGRLKEDLIKKNLLLYSCKEEVIVIDDDQNGDIEQACHRNGWTMLKARSGS